MELTKFHPAEVLLLTKGKSAKETDFVRVIVMNLILNKVLKLKREKRRANSKSAPVVITSVFRGEKYNDYKISLIETYFVNPLKKKAKLPIKTFATRASKEINQISTISKNLKIKSGAKKYFKHSFFHNIFNAYTLTSEGYKLKVKLNKDLRDSDRSLLTLLKQNPPKALELIQSLKGHIFLLPSFDHALLKMIEKTFNELNYSKGIDLIEETLDIGLDLFIDTWDYFGSDLSGSFDIDLSDTIDFDF